ncbi:unnamed protein product [Rotaria sp. Silwood2]|nr:unnamed protein product [Rotaria sp. Silwood2]
MDYLLRRERRRLAKDLINQRIIEHEGFSADVFELSNSQPLTSIQSENKQQRQQIEEDSRTFLPILLSTDQELSRPPKRTYGFIKMIIFI